MKQKVNFILHYKTVNSKLFEETDFNSTHISLYNALFQLWNGCGFDTNLSINRNDVMNLSKIGSVNTYLKCLKDLDKKGFIKYIPSHNPLKGSIINLFRFDTSSDKVVNNYSTSSDTSSDTLYKLLNKETIKLIEDNHKVVNSKLKDWLNTDDDNNDSDSERINYIYRLYPSRCPISNRGLGKGQKSKDKIKVKLDEYGLIDLEKRIQTYIKECNVNKTYYKDFNTLLNNIDTVIIDELPKKDSRSHLKITL